MLWFKKRDCPPHNFTKWTVCDEGSIYAPNARKDRDVPIGKFFVEERNCRHCGKTERIFTELSRNETNTNSGSK